MPTEKGHAGHCAHGAASESTNVKSTESLSWTIALYHIL